MAVAVTPLTAIAGAGVDVAEEAGSAEGEALAASLGAESVPAAGTEHEHKPAAIKALAPIAAMRDTAYKTFKGSPNWNYKVLRRLPVFPAGDGRRSSLVRKHMTDESAGQGVAHGLGACWAGVCSF